MTEDEARVWLARRWPDRMGLLERYVTLLREEAERQSLIARSTFDTIWDRHIVDSAQLIDLADPAGTWLDVGSGGGLPGLVVAILRDAPMVLVEPRRKRVEFLERCIVALGLTRTTVIPSKVENAHGSYDVVTARAVADMASVFASTRHVVSRETLYLLQRGQNGQRDLEVARNRWQGSFHVEHSLTNPESIIVAARGVAPR